MLKRPNEKRRLLRARWFEKPIAFKTWRDAPGPLVQAEPAEQQMPRSSRKHERAFAFDALEKQCWLYWAIYFRDRRSSPCQARILGSPPRNGHAWLQPCEKLLPEVVRGELGRFSQPTMEENILGAPRRPFSWLPRSHGVRSEYAH